MPPKQKKPSARRVLLRAALLTLPTLAINLLVQACKEYHTDKIEAK